MKNVIKASVGLLIVIILICVYKYYKRDFFYSKDGKKSLTVWRKSNGKIYVIPGCYYGIFNPKENYIYTDDRNKLYVFWNKPDSCYFSIANTREFEIDIKIDSFKYEYFSRSESITKYERYEKDFLKKDFTFKSGIDVLELDWE